METRSPGKFKTAVRIAAVALLTSFFIRFFLIDSFVVRGNSMAPTVFDGDYVFINRTAYVFSEPKRHDIVAAKPRSQSHTLIKRVIGLPRERVEIQQGTVRIKESRLEAGVALEESYVDVPTTIDTIIQLDPKEYFLLGDNRFASTDSRELGPFDSYAIKGKLLFRISQKQLADRIKNLLH